MKKLTSKTKQMSWVLGEVKSIGEQTTFNHNTLDARIIYDALAELSANVFKRFSQSGLKAFKTIAITVRFANFETKTTSKSFKESFTKSTQKKFNLEILKLVLPYLDSRSNPRQKPIRLIGAGNSALTAR